MESHRTGESAARTAIALRLALQRLHTAVVTLRERRLESFAGPMPNAPGLSLREATDRAVADQVIVRVIATQALGQETEDTRLISPGGALSRMHEQISRSLKALLKPVSRLTP